MGEEGPQHPDASDTRRATRPAGIRTMRPLVISIAGVMILLAATALILALTIHVATQRSVEVRREQRIDFKLGQLRSAVLDAETGQRGYILTGKASYLQPYNQSIARIPALLSSLSRDLAGNVTQQRLLKRVQAATDEKLAELRSAITLRRNGSLSSAIDEVLTGRGAVAMDTIRATLDTLQNNEAAQADRSAAAADAAANTTIVILVAAIAIDLLLVAGLLWTWQRNAARAAQTAEERLRLLQREQEARAQTEQALQATERERRRFLLEHSRLETVFEAMSDGVAVYDRDGELLQVNNAMRRLFAMDSVPDFTTRPLAERLARTEQRTAAGEELPPDRWVQHRILRGEVITGPAVQDMRVRALDGRESLLSLSGAPIRDHNGSITGAVLVARDITSRQQLEEEVRSERTRLRTILDHVPIVITLHSGPQHRFEFVNPHAEHILGRSAEALLGRALREAFPELHGQEPFERFDQVYRSGVPFVGLEIPIRRRADHTGEGEVLYFNLVYQPLRDAAGQIQGILQCGIDVTLQVQARLQIEALSRQIATDRDRLQQVLDVLPEAVQILDQDRRYMVSNRAASAILGTNPIGQTAPTEATESYEHYGMRLLDGTPCPIDAVPHLRALRGEDVRGAQVLLRNAESGTDIPVLVNATALRNGAGEIDGAVVVFQDISLIKNLERQREEFLATLSHDLKNPLTSILGMGELLRRRAGRLDEQHRERFSVGLSTIIATANRMANQINGLLDVSRIQAGRPLDLNRAPVNVVTLVAALVDEYRLAREQPTFVMHSAGDVLTALVDAPRLQRAVANLLDNAVKYSPGGGEVRVTVSRRSESGQDWIAIDVADQGIGVPSTEVPHVFERFYRASNAVAHVSGNGLGLAGVRQIIEQHGGSVGLSSVEGAGTTVSLRLPPVDDVLESAS